MGKYEAGSYSSLLGDGSQQAVAITDDDAESITMWVARSAGDAYGNDHDQLSVAFKTGGVTP